MRVCLILEGCYPYVRGGVSTWAHEYIKSNPNIDFVIWTVHSDRKHATKALYELPNNVVEMREIFLEDAYTKKIASKRDEKKCKKIVEALSTIIENNNDWENIIRDCRNNVVGSADLGNSKSFFDFSVEFAKNSNGCIGLSDSYYGLKSMLIPIYFLLQQSIPEADFTSSL